ncbi:hypothetical protein Cni_G14402 [Canna indica]|uniref:Uncharacterized protein n=1 Tax=Canna indica TaxID=4628 RepID=A0AAQ3KBF0_9LILI|nr:hypothetical protein Cni_G14402 [Canna indica]
MTSLASFQSSMGARAAEKAASKIYVPTKALEEQSLSPAVSVAGGGDVLTAAKSSEGECDHEEESGGESHEETAGEDAKEKVASTCSSRLCDRCRATSSTTMKGHRQRKSSLLRYRCRRGLASPVSALVHPSVVHRPANGGWKVLIVHRDQGMRISYKREREEEASVGGRGFIPNTVVGLGPSPWVKITLSLLAPLFLPHTSSSSPSSPLFYLCKSNHLMYRYFPLSAMFVGRGSDEGKRKLFL